MILDIAIILLLVPTIIYAVILNRRLSVLRRSREELARVVNSFNEATMRAEAGIPKLKKATTAANHTLKDRVEKAQTLRDDLAFMIERAEELAGRLEGAVRTARGEGMNMQSSQLPGVSYSAAAGSPPVRSAPEAQSQQRGFAEPSVSSVPSPLSGMLAEAVDGFEETATELRNALGAARAEARVSGPRDTEDFPPPQRAPSPRGSVGRAMNQSPAFDEERSEAERELLKAIQSAR
ncbi:MAG: hypothetical protein CMG46_10115 [Candidatus Marinimicrobia bacterium]|nr:hypothetical protein [Candidatus Neomarinimicrobiota bacterium]